MFKKKGEVPNKDHIAVKQEIKERVVWAWQPEERRKWRHQTFWRKPGLCAKNWSCEESQRQEFWGLIFIVNHFPGCMLPPFITSALHKSLCIQTWVSGTFEEYKNWGIHHETTKWRKVTVALKIRYRFGEFYRKGCLTTSYQSQHKLAQKALNTGLGEMMWFLPFLR